MIACYCRVSSRSQKTDSQKAELTRWLTQQGHALPAVQWFEDIERGADGAPAGLDTAPAGDRGRDHHDRVLSQIFI
jgi:hypothetical protein